MLRRRLAGKKGGEVKQEEKGLLMNPYEDGVRRSRSRLQPSATLTDPIFHHSIKNDRRKSLGGTLSHWFPISSAGILAAVFLCWPPLVPAAEAPFSDEEIIEFSPVKLPPGQIGRYADETDVASLKWGRFAIHDPTTAKLLRDGRKTPEQEAAEELAMLAISDPDAYRTAKEKTERGKKPKTPEEEDSDRRASKEREAVSLAMQDPLKSAVELETKKTPKQKRREVVAAHAILSPREFNDRVEKHKNAGLKQKEADAILAFSQPREFWNQRLREKKTGSKQQTKVEEAENPPLNPPPERAKGPDKGATQGGGR